MTAVVAPGQACTPAQRVTRSLLGYGVLAGTVFEASILIQGLTRHGFLAFLAAFAGVTTGSSSSAIVLPFYAGVLITWIWLAVTSVYLYRASG
jgi:hypothetical protein